MFTVVSKPSVIHFCLCHSSAIAAFQLCFKMFCSKLLLCTAVPRISSCQHRQTTFFCLYCNDSRTKADNTNTYSAVWPLICFYSITVVGNNWKMYLLLKFKNIHRELTTLISKEWLDWISEKGHRWIIFNIEIN